jgi:hypothetical protein
MSSTMFCRYHTSTETLLRCGKCDKPICGRCVIHAPVGIRCRDCARLRKLPIFEVSPTYYARAIVTGSALAVLLGTAYGVFAPALFRIPYFGLVLIAGIGYVIGRGISAAVNRKRGNGLKVVAASLTVSSYALGSVFIEMNLFGNLFILLAIIGGIYLSTTAFE